jgi:hypothetical protein
VLSSKGLRQITHDDSWVAAMLAYNPADRDRYAEHPM